MPQIRQPSLTRRNLIWLAVVVAVAIAGWLIAGWKLALGATVVALLASEVVERRARANRIAPG